MLVKLYGIDSNGERTYSPSICIDIKKVRVSGSPDVDYVSTNFVERQNLTMRMDMRRFTRLTNAFSKKLENHACAIALHFMHYNFARVHQTLKTTPAVAVGIENHVWSIEEDVFFFILNGDGSTYLMQCASGDDWTDKLHTPDIEVLKRLITFSSSPQRGIAMPFAQEDEEFSRQCNHVDGMLLDRYRLLSADGTDWVSSALKATSSLG